MRYNIPEELRVLRQWVVADVDKIPLCPRTFSKASVTDPATWGTFEEAMASNPPAIGFVLTSEDPYCVVDLDDKGPDPLPYDAQVLHYHILNAFPTYIERSFSGRGYHIVMRGRLGKGRRRDTVEVYDRERYIIFTGNVAQAAPIVDCQMMLEALIAEMPERASIELEDHAATMADEALCLMAVNAANGEKFSRLARGEWRSMGYPSQSEADYALLSMLAFYSQDNEQVRRIFRTTNLGQRTKAQKNDDYLNRALKKIRAKQPTIIDTSAIVNQALAAPKSAPDTAPDVDIKTEPITPPPGLIGEVARYIYESSLRPVPEIAIAASLAFFGGLLGRSYNVSGAGLNQYLILLAKTGTGKEGAAGGIDRIVAAVRKLVPAIDDFVGPAAFASGQALVRLLDARPCFVSVLGEFGLTLQQLCDASAPPAVALLKKVLLDLYSKSGHNSILRASVYADAEKNTKAVRAPNVTILGESTPENFYDGLDSSHVAEGLIPRFLLIEYTGPRPPRNVAAGFAPSEALTTSLANLATLAISTNQNGTCLNVPITETAQALLDEVDRRADKAINEAEGDTEAQLWNRVHLKALKLSALVAVGMNPHNPVIDVPAASWAINFVMVDLATMLRRFSTGDVGFGEQRQEIDVRNAVQAYLQMPAYQRRTYRTPKELLETDVIPFSYLRRRCRRCVSFKRDKKGLANAVSLALQDCVRAGILVELAEAETLKRYGVITRGFLRGPQW